MKVGVIGRDLSKPAIPLIWKQFFPPFCNYSPVCQLFRFLQAKWACSWITWSRNWLLIVQSNGIKATSICTLVRSLRYTQRMQLSLQKFTSHTIKNHRVQIQADKNRLTKHMIRDMCACVCVWMQVLWIDICYIFLLGRLQQRRKKSNCVWNTLWVIGE